jgi:YD repeat-containing protein
VRTTTGYELTARTSRQKIVFEYNGRPLSITDRNSNVTRLNYTGWDLTSAVSTAGPTDARTAVVAYNKTNRTMTVTQKAGTASRSMSYAKDTLNNLVTLTDTLGGKTTFTYTGELITKITAPMGQTTTTGSQSPHQSPWGSWSR